MIAADVERIVEADILANPDKNKDITFGYQSGERGGELGTDVIIGSDHGAGQSRCEAKINLEPSSVRRESGKTSTGS